MGLPLSSSTPHPAFLRFARSRKISPETLPFAYSVWKQGYELGKRHTKRKALQLARRQWPEFISNPLNFLEKKL